jgi:hypothetical protein
MGARSTVLLVDREDAVWNGDGLERSGLYRRVHAEDMFRVYVATPR